MPRIGHLGSRLILVLIVLLARAEGATALDSQSILAGYSVRNWTDADGPFPLGIYAIAQDPDGFLWLGARTGLIRFDGTRFVLWNERAAMLNGHVSSLCVSSDGAVWVGLFAGGVSRVHNDRVTNHPVGDGLIGGSILSLAEDGEGTIWAGGAQGLSQFRNGRWRTITQADGLPKARVPAIAVDRHGVVWIGSSVGVYRRVTPNDAFEFVSHNVARGFLNDESGAMWVTDPAMAFKQLVASAGPAGQLPGPDSTTGAGRALLEDRRGNLWTGTRGGGLIVFRRTVEKPGGIVEHFRSRDGLADDYVRTLFEDRDGNIWVGTRAGLTRLFESVITHLNGFSDDSSPDVHAVLTSRDHSLWLATADGLIRMRDGRVTRYNSADGLPGRISTALHEDRNGTLWVATTSGLARFTGTRFLPVAVPGDISLEQIFSITSDRLGRIWLSDDLQGLVRWHAGQIEHLSPDAQGNGSRVVYTDSADRVWVGFQRGGISVYRGESVVSFGPSDGLPMGSVHVIYEDRDGTLWVGTTAGLFRFDGKQFHMFATNGLPASDVGSIVEDDRHDLWLGMTSGILRIRRGELTRAAADPSHRIRYRVFGKDDGLSGILARPGTPGAARSSDGSLVFATSTTVLHVRPDQLSVDPRIGPVVIEEVVADGRALSASSGLRLAPKTARIDINYGVAGLTASSNVRFRYKLEAFDQDWEDAGERRQARYTNLPPGQYRFHVMSGTSEHGWNEPSAALDFSVLPAMYQSLEFKVLAGLLTLGAIALAWQFRLRAIRRRFDLVLAERTRVARELHDTLLQSLAAVALDFHDISQQLDWSAQGLRLQVIQAKERVEHSIRETRQSIWNLRSPALQRDGLIEALRNDVELTGAGRSVRFEWTVRGTPSRLVVYVEEQLLRIGREAITNALRHGCAKVVRIELAYEATKLMLRVSDDGLGFDVEHAGCVEQGHWGLANMRDRARDIGARLVVVSHEGQGTAVEVIVPRGADV